MVSDELIEAWDTSLLPDGLKIVDIGAPEPTWPPGYCTVIFDDDGAPEELNGQLVMPLFQVQPDRSVIIVGRESQP
jgi:hypothetical protein